MLSPSIAAVRQNTQVEVAEEDKDVKKMNLTLIIEEPDIILVETLSDMNTSAIVFNVWQYKYVTSKYQIYNPFVFPDGYQHQLSCGGQNRENRR